MIRRHVVVFLIIVAALLTAVARKASAPVEWPDVQDSGRLKFSHTFHIKQAGIACEDCHKAAKTSKLASDNLRSGHDDCVSCHEEQINNTCGYCHVHPDSIEAAPAPVRTIVFSHEQHLTMKGVECATCHKGLDEVELASSKNMPSMETCTTCHNDAQATKTCQTCHTSFTNLIPADHLVADFKKDHKKLTRLGSLDVRCSTCHSQNFCQDCHAGSGLIGIGTGDLMTEPSPRSSPTDLPRQMSLQMVHSLNYRFTHGMDARAKASDCYSCHSEQEFCAPCHNAGGNINEQSFEPASHQGPDFVRIGVGSGGGRHADLARRDIETCASCHDVQGGDPTCIRCHTDADGVRGTDPKTHPGAPGTFKHTEEGSWHTDPGAVCYDCHTDYNAHPGGVRGRNFCGYCHG
jgi:hypothetical protein